MPLATQVFGLADDYVTFAKIQNIDTNRMLGRGSAGAGDIEQMVLSSDYGLTFTYAASSLKINTPQDLQTAASPTFAGITISTTGKAYFRDTDLYIYSANDGYLDLVADTDVRANTYPVRPIPVDAIYINTTGTDPATELGYGTWQEETSIGLTVWELTIGDGTDDIDFRMIFDGGTNDCLITWMEDEDYLQFSDDILLTTTERIQFRDTAIYIYSANDGYLDLVADTGIRLSPVLTVTYGGTGAATLTDHGVLLGSGTAAITPTAVGATGEYLSGSTGADPTWATLNQAAVAGLTTTDSPVFVTVKLSGLTDGYVPYHVADATGLANSPIWTDATGVGINTATVPHGAVGAAKLAIDGTDSSTAGPHIQLTTASDNYPLLQVLGWAHDNINFAFDCYLQTATWYSSDAGSNFLFRKWTDYLGLEYAASVAAGAAVTFSNGWALTKTGGFGIGTTTVPHGAVGAAKLAIDGTNASTAGPHVQFTTASDDYPLLQILPWAHSSVNIYFDAYYDGAYKSSYVGSNYAIVKSSDKLYFQYDDSITAGNAVTWVSAMAVGLGQIYIYGESTETGTAAQADPQDGRIVFDTTYDNAAFTGSGNAHTANKIVLYSDPGSWVGGMGISGSCFNFYSGDHFKWVVNHSGTGTGTAGMLLYDGAAGVGPCLVVGAVQDTMPVTYSLSVIGNDGTYGTGVLVTELDTNKHAWIGFGETVNATTASIIRYNSAHASYPNYFTITNASGRIALWAGDGTAYNTAYFYATSTYRDLYIGVSDTVRGSIELTGHATGEATGGSIYFYTSADHDTTIDYFLVSAEEDDFLIGPSTDTDALKLTADKDLLITAGTIGISDLTDGRIPYSVSDTAGLANTNIFTNATNVSIGRDYAATTMLRVYGGTATTYPDCLTLQGGNATNTSGPAMYFQHGYAAEEWYLAAIYANADGYGVDYAASLRMSVNTGANASSWLLISTQYEDAGMANLKLGTEDTNVGVLRLMGHATGSTWGGTVFFYTAADHDTTIDYYGIYATEDDLVIGPSTDADALKLDSNKDLYLTAGDAYIYGRTANVLTLGSGAAGVDYILTFNGENNDGVLTWMEDEDYFQFSDDVFIGTEKLYFNGTDTSLYESGDDIHLDTPANKTLVLDEVVYEDIRVSSGNIDRPGLDDPTWVSVTPGGGAITTRLLEFAVDDVGTFTVQIPHCYKTGQDIKVHLHWTPGTRGNEENGKFVGWKVDYAWANIDGTFGAMSTADLSDACNGVDWEHNMTPEATIDGHTAAKGISSMLICNVKRTDAGAEDDWASTTSGQLPLLLEVDFHFPIDTIGSRDWGSK